MTARHFVDVEVEDDVATSFRFTCTGDDTDVCRAWCVDGCDESCTARAVYVSAQPLDDVAQAPVDAHRFEPMRPPSCRVADWLNASSGYDTYGADDVDEPYRPGRHRIEEEWDDECYLWTYADPAGATS